MMNNSGGSDSAGVFALLAALSNPEEYKQKLSALDKRGQDLAKVSAEARKAAEQAEADRSAAKKLRDEAETQLKKAEEKAAASAQALNSASSKQQSNMALNAQLAEDRRKFDQYLHEHKANLDSREADVRIREEALNKELVEAEVRLKNTYEAKHRLLEDEWKNKTTVMADKLRKVSEDSDIAAKLRSELEAKLKKLRDVVA